MTYELIKDWPSKRHGKIIRKGAWVVITIKDELQELIELECIVKPKKKKAKKEAKKEDKKEN